MKKQMGGSAGSSDDFGRKSRFEPLDDSPFAGLRGSGRLCMACL